MLYFPERAVKVDYIWIQDAVMPHEHLQPLRRRVRLRHGRWRRRALLVHALAAGRAGAGAGRRRGTPRPAAGARPAWNSISRSSAGSARHAAERAACACALSAGCGRSASSRGWRSGPCRRCSCRAHRRPTRRGRRRARPSVRRGCCRPAGGARCACRRGRPAPGPARPRPLPPDGGAGAAISSSPLAGCTVVSGRRGTR